MKFEVLSDIGKKRQLNEDRAAVLTLPNGLHLAVLLDGMGGHQGGDVASSTALRLMAEEFEKLSEASFQSEEEWMEWLKEVVLYVNRTLYNIAKEESALQGMGTTMEAILVKDDVCYGVHIGDSRVYYINDEDITQLTTDHSFVNVLVDRGEITEQEAEVHPQRNWILKALGSERFVEPDCYQVTIKPTSTLLMCSDGLSNKVQKESLHKIVISKASLKEKAEKLVEKANEMGGEDNISVILLSPLEKGGA